jgi:hypothetical protein
MADKHGDETDSPDKETERPSGSSIDDEFVGRHGPVASPHSRTRSRSRFTRRPPGRWLTRFAESPTTTQGCSARRRRRFKNWIDR